MKRFLFLAFFFPATAFAQVWYVGLKSGATLSNYKSSTPWKEVVNAGFTGGVTAYHQLGTNLGIGIDLLYVEKGYYHKVCNTITDKLDASYIELPISADYTFLIPGLKNFKGHVSLGVYGAYWMSGKYKMQGFDVATEDFDFNQEKAKRFDFGPLTGARVEYILPTGSVSLDLRYELGLPDLQNKAGDNTHNSNRTFLIGLSYMRALNL